MATNLIVAGELIFMAQKSEYKDEDFLRIKQVQNFSLESWIL